MASSCQCSCVGGWYRKGCRLESKKLEIFSIGIVQITVLSILLHRLHSLYVDSLVFLLALLKRQGVNVKGLLKADPVKEEPQPYIDCTGNLQVTALAIDYRKCVCLLVHLKANFR